jgi:two-component system nitrate/nitrite response regulator NarL
VGTRVSTIIIEPRSLVREALELLLRDHSYHFARGAGSIADIASSPIAADVLELVILGAQSADNAVAGADGIRKLWPDSKIVLLIDYASSGDYQKLLTSQIDGCVPLFVSPDTLISTLDLIVTRGVRVMVVGETNRPSNRLAQRENSHQPGIKIDKCRPSEAEHEALSITMIALPHPELPVRATGTSDLNITNGGTQYVSPLRKLKLSERETQILDGLVKGHANKVIARVCGISEATVKVHMKSILRKIQVANRTQAAIWALENGRPGDEIEGRAAKAAAATRGSAH